MGRRQHAKRKGGSFFEAVLEWAETLVFSVFLVIICFTFVFRIANVVGQSMENTLFENDRLIISHLFYTPENGDIVVIDSKDLDEMIIKRIIATSNQHVEIDYNDGTVTVDGEVLSEPYIKEHDMRSTGRFADAYYNEEKDIYEYEVPFGCVFVLGDNRNNSADSRMFGCVSQEDIVGRVMFRIYSETAGLGRVD